MHSPLAAGSWVNLKAFIFCGKSSWHSKQNGSSARAGATANTDTPTSNAAKPATLNRFRHIPVRSLPCCQNHTAMVA